MPAVNCIAHTCVGVGDLDRALGFYRDALGLEVIKRTDMPSGAVLVLLKCPLGEGQIELYWKAGSQSPAAAAGGSGPVPPTAAVGLRHVAFQVDDVRQVIADLAARGVTVARRPPEPGQAGGMIAFVKDPDGADVELMQQT
jgi:lactoylglutathione lyase